MNERQLTELIVHVVAEFFAVGFDLRLFGFIFICESFGATKVHF